MMIVIHLKRLPSLSHRTVVLHQLSWVPRSPITLAIGTNLSPLSSWKTALLACSHLQRKTNQINLDLNNIIGSNNIAGHNNNFSMNHIFSRLQGLPTLHLQTVGPPQPLQFLKDSRHIPLLQAWVLQPISHLLAMDLRKRTN